MGRGLECKCHQAQTCADDFALGHVPRLSVDLFTYSLTLSHMCCVSVFVYETFATDIGERTFLSSMFARCASLFAELSASSVIYESLFRKSNFALWMHDASITLTLTRTRTRPRQPF